jgi:hypothetical protein
LHFSVSVSLDFPCSAYAFFSECLPNICQDLRHTFSEICTKLDAVPLPDPTRNRIRPDTQLQIKGCKQSALAPSFVKCIYCCIAQLQLPYRSQHQSQKWWIPPRTLSCEHISIILKLLSYVWDTPGSHLKQCWLFCYFLWFLLVIPDKFDDIFIQQKSMVHFIPSHYH